MNLAISSITILLTGATDEILLNTALPTPFPALGDTPTVSMKTARDHAQTYCKQNFPGVPVHVINTRP